MKLKYIFLIAAILASTASCTLEAKDASEVVSLSSPIPVAAVSASIAAPTDIKDLATWTATYNYVISQYQETVARKNAGDNSTLNRSLELITMASDLNTAGETLKAPLSGQVRLDFEARMQGLKEEFSRIATMY